MRLNLLSPAIIFLFLFACNNEKSPEQATGESGPGLETVTLSSLTGEPINWKQYEGKAVFINFWATWCKPCIEEMPSIRNLMEELEGENISFLFASDESPEQINRFRERTGFDFPFVRVENLEELNIMALPTTYIFTPSGKLAFSEMGFRKWDDPSNIKQVKNIIAAK